jgi:hypothetical protein
MYFIFLYNVLSEEFFTPINTSKLHSTRVQKSVMVSCSVSYFPILTKSCNVSAVSFFLIMKLPNIVSGEYPFSGCRVVKFIDRHTVLTKLISIFIITFVGNAPKINMPRAALCFPENLLQAIMGELGVEQISITRLFI